MAPQKKVVYDATTGQVSVCGIKHNKDGIRDQALDGIAFDPEQGIFCFRGDAFNQDWLAHNKVQLVVRQ